MRSRPFLSPAAPRSCRCSAHCCSPVREADMASHPSRREFLVTAASTVVAATVHGQTGQPSTLTVGTVIARIQDKLGVPWRDGSRDGLKAGTPDAIVTGIATTAMATADVLRRAAAAGRNLVFTQEPTFYTP